MTNQEQVQQMVKRVGWQLKEIFGYELTGSHWEQLIVDRIQVELVSAAIDEEDFDDEVFIQIRATELFTQQYKNFAIEDGEYVGEAKDLPFMNA